MLLKPFLGPIIDLFMAVILHKPWVVCLGGKVVGTDCVYENYKPDVTFVSSHKKPKVFNFGHHPLEDD